MGHDGGRGMTVAAMVGVPVMNVTLPSTGQNQRTSACLRIFSYLKLDDHYSYGCQAPGYACLTVGVALIKPPKIFYAQTPFFVGVQCIYVDKMYPNFMKQITRTCPVGCVNKEFCVFC